MGNWPSEYYGKTCGICSRQLPPVRDFGDIHLKEYERKNGVVKAYSFLNDSYFRVKGRNTYYCPEDFFMPRDEYLAQQEIDKNKEREEQKRREERREEIARQQEAKQQRELARQQEQEEEQHADQEEEHEAPHEAEITQSLIDQAEQSEEQDEYAVSTYRPTLDQLMYEGTYYDNLLREDARFEANSNEEIEAVSVKLRDDVEYSIRLLKTDDEELDGAWLKCAQVVLLTYYLQVNSFSKLNKELMKDFLAYLQQDLSNREFLTLAKAMVELNRTNPADFGGDLNFEFDTNRPLQENISRIFILAGQSYKDSNLWLQRCLYTVISSQTENKEFAKLFSESTCQNWTTFDWFELFEKFEVAEIPEDKQKYVLHLVQTYCLDTIFVKGCVDQGPLQLIEKLDAHVQKKRKKGLNEIFEEIRESNLVEDSILSKVESIAKVVYSQLKNLNIKDNYKEHLTSNISSVAKTFQSLSKNSSATDAEIAKSIITLMCAVYDYKSWFPRKTQVVALLIMIFTRRNQINKLLEIKTGEGKSCIVALFATVLCMQGKKVDIVTNSPILATRDAKKWKDFYQMFNFSVAHNTTLQKKGDIDIDAVKKDCYKQDIVYGTVESFSADILHDEFEKKNLRSDRPFESVIVDEVDMLMLDEGVQFTYLSHKAAILNHVEPVLATVWALIGPLRLTLTTEGDVLYAGTPKLFTEAIFECLDPHISNVNNPLQILFIAKEKNIITDAQYERLSSDEQEEKKLAITELTKSQALKLLEELQNHQDMPEFLAYSITSKNVLVANTAVSDYEDAEKILLLDLGLACPLNTKQEVIDRATAIIKEKLKFTDDERNKKLIKKATTILNEKLNLNADNTEKEVIDILKERLDDTENAIEQIADIKFRFFDDGKDKEVIEWAKAILNDQLSFSDYKNNEKIIENVKVTIKKKLNISDGQGDEDVIKKVTAILTNNSNDERDKVIRWVNAIFKSKLQFTDEKKDDIAIQRVTAILKEKLTDEEVITRIITILREKLIFIDAKKNEMPVKLPLFLKVFVMDQVTTYVENAIRALHMEEDRQYAITKGKIVPVDFQNSGVMEVNKKWGGGLQQMLEMKHSLPISPISLVTNFLSNVEFFKRYADGGICGMSGTLGLDSWSNTTHVLSQLYQTSVCSIPTFKVRKLYEKPALIVETREKWFQQIASVVNEESQNVAKWKTGRATLILCEDIKSAEDLRDYVIKKAGWSEDKIFLYAHSNSKQLKIIRKKKQLSPGDVIIATNLAGRGTDIKVDDAVNESGGLLCLVTFLARNRRVELQAFGRTARSGNPGSVRCILNASAMPSHYSGLNIQTIRKIRAEEESLRLIMLMNNDVEEVQVKEKLFKDYCRFLSTIYDSFQGRDDLKMVVDLTNENWGVWLETKKNQIEDLQLDILSTELSTIIEQWKPTVPAGENTVKLQNANFYHFIQFGNELIIDQGESNAKKAIKYYDESIEMESRYGLVAYYNRAYCKIFNSSTDYEMSPLEDLQAAAHSVEKYIDELSLLNACVNMVQQMRKTVQRESDGSTSEADPRDFTAQIQAKLNIYSNLKRNIDEAIEKIKELGEASYTAKTAGIFSLIPDADYTTNLELISLWTMGLEIVYTIEKEPEFNWGALGVFLLGVVQVVGGVALTVLTVGTAANIGMALIAEGVADCIAGIEGMITGEFSWVEWGISKATGLALSLISGGVSRLATTGFKAIKTSYKVASTVGRQLKAIPTVAKLSMGSAARTNLKNAAKHVVKEVGLQMVDYATEKTFDAAMSKIYLEIGNKVGSNLTPSLKAEFTNEGFFSKLVDEKFTSSTKNSVEIYFKKLNDATIEELSNDSDIKQKLTDTSMSLFEQISDENSKNKKVKFVARIAEFAVTTGTIADCAANLQVMVDQYIPKMKEMSKTADTDVFGSQNRNKDAVIKLKNELATYIQKQFSKSITALIQGKLSPVIGHVLNKTIGKATHNMVDKYIVRSDNTLEQLTAGQHANYIRSVGADKAGTAQFSAEVVSSYADYIQNTNNAGSIMDLRIVAERYGQGVVIYEAKKGQLIKNSSIEPIKRTSKEKIKLIYTPPPDDTSVGHYDVVDVNERHIRVQAENSNCLFHAFALGKNPALSTDQLKAEASKIRKEVEQEIRDEPQKWGEHITLRTEMDNLCKGNRFALIGAGPINPDTKVKPGLFSEHPVKEKIYTMYEQKNGVIAKAIKTYDKDILIDKKGKATLDDDARLQNIKVHMANLNLSKNRGKRCFDTKPVHGMIKRHVDKTKTKVSDKIKAEDSEVSFHLVPSRAGANAGEKYANAVMTSPHYNNLEKKIWTSKLTDTIGDSDFEMTVESDCGRVDRDYNGETKYTADIKKNLKERFKLVEEKNPKAYRVTKTKFTIHLPDGTKPKQLADIKKEYTDLKCTTNKKDNTVTVILPEDDELFVPKKANQLKANGELDIDELQKAKSKIRRKTAIGKPIHYKTPVKGKTSDKRKAKFGKEANDFLTKGF